MTDITPALCRRPLLPLAESVMVDLVGIPRPSEVRWDQPLSPRRGPLVLVDPRSGVTPSAPRTLAILGGRSSGHLDLQPVGDLVGAYGGSLGRATDLTFVAGFVSSVAAVACAVAIERFVARTTTRGTLAIGIAVGDLRDINAHHWAGPAIGRAAKLTSTAANGTIVLDDLVRRFVCACRPELTATLVPQPGQASAWELRWDATLSTVPLPPEVARACHALFVGRDDERRALDTVWNQAVSGRRTTVFVSGEPGIGKTRLASEFAADAHRAGAVVMTGRCDEDATTSFQPFAEAVGTYVAARPPTHLWLEVGAPLDELARVVPALRSALDHVHPSVHDGIRTMPIADEVVDDDTRRALFAAVDALLAAAAAGGPLVLLLDDLQWADRSTLLLLRHLVEQHDDLPLLILGTYRDTELDACTPFGELLAELVQPVELSNTPPRLRQLGLGGLGVDDVAQMLRAAMGRALTADETNVAHALTSETAGNPLFLAEVMRHLTETGGLATVVNRHLAHSDTIGIPEGLRDVISRRLSRLSADANCVLRAAAVIGRDFDAALVASLPECEVADGTLDAALHEAVAARILQPTRVGRFSFVHALVRQTLYDDLSTMRRARAHRHVVDAFEAAREADPEVVGMLAFHARRAASTGFGPRAAQYSLDAAHAALARAAFEEAAQHLDGGLAALDSSEATPADETGALRCELMLALAHAQRMMGDDSLARVTSLHAAAIARLIGSPRHLARALLRHGIDEQHIGTPDQVVLALAAEASARLGPADDALHAQVLAIEALTLSYGGRMAPADAISSRALQLAERSGDDEALRAAVVARNASLTGSPHGPRRRIALAQRYAHVMTPSRRSSPLRAGVEMNGWPHLLLGDRTTFDRSVTALGALAQERPSRLIRSIFTIRQAVQALLDGRFSAVESLSSHALELAGGSGFTAHTWAAQLGWLAYERGEQSRVVATLQQAAATHPALPAYRAGHLFMLSTTGRTEEAADGLRTMAEDDFAVLVRDWTFTAQVTLLIETAVLVGDRELTTRLAEMARPYSGQLAVIAEAVALGAVDRYLGMSAAIVGAWDEAEHCFEQALAFEERIGSPPLTARTSHWLATTLAHRGGRDDVVRAQHIARGVATDAARMGMTQLARDASVLSVAIRGRG